MAKLNENSARLEVQKWLDFKKINKKKQEANADNIEAIVDALCEGQLVLKEDMVFEYELNHPLKDGEDGKTALNKLSFKPRLKVSEIQSRTRNTGTDMYAILTAHIAALTGQNSALIGELDTTDYEVARSIAIFFL